MSYKDKAQKMEKREGFIDCQTSTGKLDLTADNTPACKGEHGVADSRLNVEDVEDVEGEDEDEDDGDDEDDEDGEDDEDDGCPCKMFWFESLLRNVEKQERDT